MRQEEIDQAVNAISETDLGNPLTTVASRREAWLRKIRMNRTQPCLGPSYHLITPANIDICIEYVGRALYHGMICAANRWRLLDDFPALSDAVRNVTDAGLIDYYIVSNLSDNLLALDLISVEACRSWYANTLTRYVRQILFQAERPEDGGQFSSHAAAPTSSAERIREWRAVQAEGGRISREWVAQGLYPAY